MRKVFSSPVCGLVVSAGALLADISLNTGLSLFVPFSVSFVPVGFLESLLELPYPFESSDSSSDVSEISANKAVIAVFSFAVNS